MALKDTNLEDITFDSLLVFLNVYRNIRECKRLIDTIGKLELRLDESQFCSQCSPCIANPKLTLIIKYPDRVHRYEGVQTSDLKLISGFFEGNEFDDDGDPVFDRKQKSAKLLRV